MGKKSRPKQDGWKVKQALEIIDQSLVDLVVALRQFAEETSGELLVKVQSIERCSNGLTDVIDRYRCSVCSVLPAAATLPGIDGVLEPMSQSLANLVRVVNEKLNVQIWRCVADPTDEMSPDVCKRRFFEVSHCVFECVETQKSTLTRLKSLYDERFPGN
jgi:hypothetical protein